MGDDDGLLEPLEEKAPPASLNSPGAGALSRRARWPFSRRDKYVSLKDAGPLNKLRHSLARMLILVLFLIALCLIAAATFGPADSREAIQAIATLIFPSLVTLAGTSFAWFYAQDRKVKKDDTG